MRITRTLLPHLRSRPDARVLTIGLSFVDGASADPATIRANQDALRGASEALRREVAGGSVRMQFLGRRAITRALDPGTTAEHGAATSRVDRPQYVASVAVQMLLAGTRERFLGTPGDLMGRVNAVLGALFHTAPKHRRA
jgi:short-subunit dehydrogenase